MKTIILFGLRRSGNHFVISTILQQYSNYVHINDTILSLDKFIQYGKIKANRKRVDSKWTGFKGVECVVISMENKMINFEEIKKFNKIPDCYLVILLRCPYDHLSSVWKVYNKNENETIKIIKLWKMYSRIFYGNNNFIKILYDKYSSNKKYLIDILQNQMKIKIKSLNMNGFAKWGNSSFRNKENSKRIYGKLETCVCKNEPKFIKLLNDKEIKKLWLVVLYQTDP